MYQPPPGYEIVLRTRSPEEDRESRLVLDAAGVPAKSHHQEGWWLLVVRRDDLTSATAELNAYRQENLEPSYHRDAPAPVFAGAKTAVIAYAGVLIVIAIFSAQSTLGLQWLSAGRMQAGRVMAGEWWRTVTALTLHVDGVHLVANLVFGALFGILAGQVLGGGVAWLAIVVAGALGNLINAMVRAPDHASIGASTAVFAALGLLVAHALRPRKAVPEKLLRRWSPMIGGLVLLAYTGLGGDRTDVVAHLAGFVAGLLTGWVGCSLPTPWLAHRKVQLLAGFAAIASVCCAWIVGLIAAG
jgi:membrane associated rhomboid family serine protease